MSARQHNTHNKKTNKSSNQRYIPNQRRQNDNDDIDNDDIDNDDKGNNDDNNWNNGYDSNNNSDIDYSGDDNDDNNSEYDFAYSEQYSDNSQRYEERDCDYDGSRRSTHNSPSFPDQSRNAMNKQSQKCDSDYRVSTKTQRGRKYIAEKTVQIISDGPKIGKYTIRHHRSIEHVDIELQIKNSIKYTQTYKPDIAVEIKKSIRPHSKMCKFEVVADSSFAVARKLCTQEHFKHKTCVLNFASATKPGGGFLNGRNAQEESLSRQSALYATIKDNPMYKYNKNCTDDLYNDYMIYSSRVPVFRSSFCERLLSQSEIFLVSIITSAAPNLQNINRSCTPSLLLKWKGYEKILQKRMRKILAVAINNGNDAIVLGAYGCGVFENDPKIVSKFFKKILVDEGFGKYFVKVSFAILGKRSENFRVFNDAFGNLC